jgi:hypothetical protein
MRSGDRAEPDVPELDADLLRGYVDKFTRLFLGSIYKWVQAPISLHVGTLDLDRERALQLPVVQDRSWTLGGTDAGSPNGRADEAGPCRRSGSDGRSADPESG